MVPNRSMFVRIKRIKGKPYAYLVENVWKDGSSRQRVKRYLGRVIQVRDQSAPSVPPSVKGDDLIWHLIGEELAPLGDVRIDISKRKVTRDGQEVVLALNGGFLCSYTVKQVFRALNVTGEDHPGTALAEAFSRAGLRIPQDRFVSLYLRYRS